MIGCSFSAIGQTNTKEITIAEISGTTLQDTIGLVNNHYYYKGQFVSAKDIQLIVKDHPEANQQMKNARSNKITSTILSFAGGAILGYSLARSLTKNKFDFKGPAIGLGFIVISLPLETSYRRSTSKAVQLYNESLRIK